jgi:wyosine [tRNA(Phe)-imidazoG37] synthetase (radical SAM superfamily)
MLTYCVTIDKASNSDIFLKLMNELKFVVKVKPEIESNAINAMALALPGEPAADEVLALLIEIAEKAGTITATNSRKKNLNRFNSWQRKALR